MTDKWLTHLKAHVTPSNEIRTGAEQSSSPELCLANKTKLHLKPKK